VGDERDAAHGLHACGAKGADDFRFGIGRFPCRARGAAGRRQSADRKGSAAGDGDFLLDEALVTGKIEVVKLEQSGLGIEEREAGVVVVDDALQSFDDAAEKFGEFAAGDQDIVISRRTWRRSRSRASCD